MSFGKKCGLYLLVVIFLAGFLLLFPQHGWSKSSGRVIYVVGDKALTPFEYLNDRQLPEGFFIDVLETIAKKQDLSLNFQMVHWTEVESLLYSSRVDLILGVVSAREESAILPHMAPIINISSVPDVSQREAAFLPDVSGKEIGEFYFSLPVIKVPYAVFTRKGLEGSRLSDVAGKTVIVEQGSAEKAYLQSSYLTSKVLIVDNPVEGIHLVSSGQYDFVLMGLYQGLSMCKKLKINNVVPLESSLFTKEWGFTITHGDITLARMLKQGLSQIYSDGTYEKLYKKWFDQFKHEGFVDKTLLIKVLSAFVVAIFLILLWNFSLKKQVARVVKEREKLIDFIRDGILAVDSVGRITLINHTAMKLLGIHYDAEGEDVDSLVPEINLKGVLSSKEAVYDLEQNVGGAPLIINKVPVTINGQICGAIASFRDMSEIHAMAEEMTGVRMYVESLRVQNHEFMNKLQAIAGLIQLGKYTKALNFISQEQAPGQTMASMIAERIKNPAVGGILLGKMGRCRELGIGCEITPDSYCGESIKISDQALVIIVGNLMENAIEAMLQASIKVPRISFSIFDESNQIMLSVWDNAGGLTEENAEKIFEKGFSTKARPRTSGYGLYNIRRMVDALGGDICLDFKYGEYTEFIVTLPNGEGGDLIE
ncbi:MAG: transporter substrate-binding domain-containing protein [Aminobacterium sp.]|nr:transporter substrate-binding domain-containing protein [Aminobacterium sp.]MDD4229063.1 transporter substrate-binding domain-containing protein [Aminobacterium sp.]MDD4551945.1 transporter substrate-binding domain-containing protein [Aminobacterium sp.]